jgi:hypothetical protein
VGEEIEKKEACKHLRRTLVGVLDTSRRRRAIGRGSVGRLRTVEGSFLVFAQVKAADVFVQTRRRTRKITDIQQLEN